MTGSQEQEGSVLFKAPRVIAEDCLKLGVSLHRLAFFVKFLLLCNIFSVTVCF